ncbi:hypothetical protein ACN1C3_04315 [Pseudomonas sp. H11T01]|uniref:hypothetical protein n=1 Tax=Pseudomonas sp. H11T01 TaxID=3402749 RepID=UPI003AD62CCC
MTHSSAINMTPQQPPRIGIVIGSTRESRFGEKPAHWIPHLARAANELLDDIAWWTKALKSAREAA